MDLRRRTTERAHRRRPDTGVLVRAFATVASMMMLAAAVALAPIRDSSGSAAQERVVAGADTCLVLAGAVVLAAALLLALRESEPGPFAAHALSSALTCWAVSLLPAALLDLRATADGVEVGPHLGSAMTWAVVAGLLVGGRRRAAFGGAPPWLVGAASGAVIGLAGPVLEQVAPVGPATRSLAVGAVVVGALVAADAVTRRVGTPTPLVWPLGVALALLGAGDVARVVDRGTAVVVGGAGLTVMGGALVWLVALRMHRAALAIDRRRVLDQGRRARRAEEFDREARERLHEVSATVAGLAHASRLIAEGSPIDDLARRRLAHLMDGELARVDRLAGGKRNGSTSSRVDVVLDVLVTSLALQGHQVDDTPCDAEVAVGEDVLLELLHVLLLNGVRHAGGRGLRVRCTQRGSWLAIRVEDDGPGVPVEVGTRIFAWGEAGPDSPGQGIGLAGARRLALEAGGELELTQPVEGCGAAFLLTLPLAPATSEPRGREDEVDADVELDA